MDNLSDLERGIRERLAAAEVRLRENRETIRRQMLEREQRTRQFEITAKRLLEAVIRPRLLKVAELFSNAHVEEGESSTAHRCVCHFDRTADYPASTKLDFCVSSDAELAGAVVTFTLEILPVFFQFDGHDRFVAPLAALDEGAVATWVDSKLLQFVDTYLKLQLVDQYQQENMVVDPVCGMRINRAAAGATTEFEGMTYYFCVEECQQKFAQDPHRYLANRR